MLKEKKKQRIEEMCFKRVKLVGGIFVRRLQHGFCVLYTVFNSMLFYYLKIKLYKMYGRIT